MRGDISSIEFFLSIPDDLLVEIALKDWESLEKLCTALTLDLQILRESTDQSEPINLC